MLKISKDTQRRFVLGQQGLWPGRRFKGLEGTEEAMRLGEYLQLDPLNCIARSQDLTLLSRVIDYNADFVGELAYEQRKFFDWGTWLAMRPMEELPYWRVWMKEYEKKRATHNEIPASTYKEVIADLKSRGPLGNRAFEMKTRIENYRGRKETAVALFRLWLEGTVMTHNREKFERVYDLSVNVAPKDLPKATRAEAERFFALKKVGHYGLSPLKHLHNGVNWDFSKDRQALLIKKLVGAGEIHPVQIEGSKTTNYVRTRDLSDLNCVADGRTPKSWRTLDTTTKEEVSFLAPLEIVSARGRAKEIFDFDYIWEVYKPLHLRKWGYYTLPILWDDKLVARLDPKLDRPTKTLEILGFWPEQKALEKNEDFHRALQLGLRRLANFVGAKKIAAPNLSRGPVRSAILSSLK